MRRPSVVIVGAGLGGCVLAHALSETHDVTLIERSERAAADGRRVLDIGKPAVLDPHLGTGLGGSTQLWHNGLIEIEPHVFAADWPFERRELDGHYERAYELLGGVPVDRVRQALAELKRRLHASGLPELTLQGLYYPQDPVNVWQSLRLEGRVRLVRGEVAGWDVDGSSRVTGLRVEDGRGGESVQGDLFVLSAGGLGTPLLLDQLATNVTLPGVGHVGRHYEDHPMGFVGEIQVDVPLYRLWNFKAPGTDGNLRLLLVVKVGDMDVSFQLRPAAAFYRDRTRQRVGSVLNELRRRPWDPRLLVRLFSHWDDVLDILSFRFGIQLPTRHYTLLMTAQMPPSEQRAVWLEPDPQTGRERCVRNWVLTDEYRADLQRSIDAILQALGPVLKDSRVFPTWFDDLRTGAHHSGTARMSPTPATGVCDSHGRVHGMRNLYVCDGSAIPSSGVANTGLTIAALALRLAAHLQRPAAAEGAAP